MKKLFSHLKKYRMKCVLAPLFKFLEAGLDLAVPLIIARIVDNGVGSGDTGYILRCCLLLVLMTAAGFGLAAAAQYFAAKAAVCFSRDASDALFSHIQTLSYGQLDKLGTSSLITRISSDMDQVQAGINLALRLLLRSPFIVFGSVAAAFLIDVRAGLIFSAAVLVLGAAVFLIMSRSIPAFRRVQDRLDSVTELTRGSLHGVRVIRAFCKENDETAGFGREAGALFETQKTAGRISAFLNPVTFLIINLFTVLLIHTGALRVQAGLLTQGAVLALYNYMAQILVELVKLANLIISIARAAACGRRIEEVLELECDMPEPPASAPQVPGACAVEFRNVSLRYPGAGADALSGVSFSVGYGQTAGIIGGTGSGKTTAVNLIPRFYDVTGGQVLVGGNDVRDYRLDELRGKIGVAAQRSVLMNMSIRDNLLWGNPGASDEELREALKTAQAEDIIADKPGGLDFIVEKGGRNLSGGQRQRLAVARALARDPQILILDDSASALDLATDAAMTKAIRSLPRRPAVLIVSQRVASVMRADKILVLNEGKAVGCGTHEELMKSCGIYREICRSQLREEAAL